MKKNLLIKLLGAVASVSTLFAGFAANSGCLIYIYEPEMPEAAKSLVKLK